MERCERKSTLDPVFMIYAFTGSNGETEGQPKTVQSLAGSLWSEKDSSHAVRNDENENSEENKGWLRVEKAVHNRARK
jgi:hypothetical protein